ncbi:MAG: HD domain-containing protein [Candidatus Nomurabacteria bacterium]|jgi:HD superfamily phosphohydrolase YqeK|nr:HD domain-containing protein [Candidatus Nomurabacteria bacterium]
MTKLEKVLVDILMSDEFLDVMRRIDEPAPKGAKISPSFNSLHGITHAKHVANYAVDFLREMKASQHEIQLAKITALLHDVAIVGFNKEKHAERGAKIAREWLTKYNMNASDIDIIYHAILSHSNGKEINNLVDAAILLGDKMDITGDRLNLSRQIRDIDALTKSLLMINKVEFIVDENLARLRWDVEPGYDIKLFAGWPKAVTVPAKVAKYLERDFVFEFDGKELTEQEFLELIK